MSRWKVQGGGIVKILSNLRDYIRKAAMSKTEFRRAFYEIVVPAHGRFNSDKSSPHMRTYYNGRNRPFFLESTLLGRRYFWHTTPEL